MKDKKSSIGVMIFRNRALKSSLEMRRPIHATRTISPSEIFDDEEKYLYKKNTNTKEIDKYKPKN